MVESTSPTLAPVPANATAAPPSTNEADQMNVPLSPGFRSRVGASLTAVTWNVKVRGVGSVSAPESAVPPVSMTWNEKFV